MINAIAMIKLMAMFITGITMAALFLPEKLKWLLYVFPNYWTFEGFYRMFIRTDLPLAPVNLTAAVLSLALVALLVSRFGRKLRFIPF